ncbi:hypothetical protein HRbin33_01165 [bacterium HR33]|nr:hypothetical protein HRbin33_01165 [bacterium HR33]
MLEWLIPVCFFWLAAAIYLGGMAVDVEGGNGLRQVLGLLATFVLFVAAWRVLGLLLGGIAPVLGDLVLPTIVSALLLPIISRAGFGLLGVKVRRKQHEAH